MEMIWRMGPFQLRSVRGIQMLTVLGFARLSVHAQVTTLMQQRLYSIARMGDISHVLPNARHYIKMGHLNPKTTPSGESYPQLMHRFVAF
jgi:hypothetical protein